MASRKVHDLITIGASVPCFITTSKKKALGYLDYILSQGYIANIIDQQDRIAYYFRKGWVER